MRGEGLPRTGDDPDQLGTSQHDFHLLIDAITDYAIVMLDPDGAVRSWNTGARRMFGYRADEIVGQHVSIFEPEPEASAIKLQQELRSSAARGRLEDEGWRVRKDGSRLWASVITTPLRGERRRLLGFAQVISDLTQRKEMDELNRRLARVNDRVEIARSVQKGTINELFRVSLVLQSLAGDVPGKAQARVDQLITDIDNVIVDLRRNILKT